MLDFDKYVMRHGEFWVQALVEQEERKKGIRASIEIPLEDRWNILMNDQQPQMAA